MVTLRKILKKMKEQAYRGRVSVVLKNGKVLKGRKITISYVTNAEVVVLEKQVLMLLENFSNINTKENGFEDKLYRTMFDTEVKVEKFGGVVRQPGIKVIITKSLPKGVIEIIVVIKAPLFASDTFIKELHK